MYLLKWVGGHVSIQSMTPPHGAVNGLSASICTSLKRKFDSSHERHKDVCNNNEVLLYFMD